MEVEKGSMEIAKELEIQRYLEGYSELPSNLQPFGMGRLKTLIANPRS